MNNDKNYIYKYYAPFLSSKNHEYVSPGSEYDSSKRRVSHQKNIILDLLLDKSNSFEWQVSLLFFLSTTRNYHHIWIRLLNTLITQTKKNYMIKQAKLLLT